jgi:hypothetical protein
MLDETMDSSFLHTRTATDETAGITMTRTERVGRVVPCASGWSQRPLLMRSYAPIVASAVDESRTER